MTKIAILSSKNPNNIGGHERLIQYLIRATDGTLNPKDYDQFDYFIATDDIAAWYLPLDRPHSVYLTTPRRSFYDMYYHTPFYQRPLIWIARPFDRYHMQRVSDIVSISHNIRNRVYKYYNRESSVIYPCIEVDKYHYEKPDNYWLAVQRIDKWKRIEMIIDAFRDMPEENLCLFGNLNPKMNHMVQNLPKNVVWETGNESYLIKKYSRCKGVISMGIDEDFGYVPIEAMASGKYVISPYEGGYIETVKGWCDLINPTKEALIRDVKKYNIERGAMPEFRRLHATKFDYSVFKQRWLNHIKINIEQKE